MNLKINESIFNQFPVLKSERILYREFKDTDALNLFLLRSNDEVMQHIDRPKMRSVSDAASMIESINDAFKNKQGVSWAIVERTSNTFMGYIGFWRMMQEHCRAEVGYMLLPDFWRKGLMGEALRTVVKFGFNKLNLHSIEANCNPANVGSIKLLEKTGFNKEAYFRENYLFNNKFLDSVIYSLLETDYS